MPNQVAAVGGEHHARAVRLLGEGTQPFVAFGNGSEEAGTLRAESAIFSATTTRCICLPSGDSSQCSPM